MKNSLIITLDRLLMRWKYKFLYNSHFKLYKLRGKYIKNPNGICGKERVYIIRRASNVGFFASFFNVLGHIVYASERGYKIVIDMENYLTLYNDDTFLETKNAWEYYFEQPDDISLESAYSYENIILSTQSYMHGNVPCYLYLINPISEDMVRKLSYYVDKYIKIKRVILEEVETIKNDWGDDVLGLHIRGTDMKNTNKHPLPVDIEQYKKEVDALLETYKVKKIFCCTDEEFVLESFKNIYKDLVVNTSSLRSIDGQAVHTNKQIAREHHKYELGKEVLIDALLLSKCDYLICGHSNVAYGAMVFNKNLYKKVVLIESNEYTRN